jgi:hypothetical protein
LRAELAPAGSRSTSICAARAASGRRPAATAMSEPPSSTAKLTRAAAAPAFRRRDLRRHRPAARKIRVRKLRESRVSMCQTHSDSLKQPEKVHTSRGLRQLLETERGKAMSSADIARAAGVGVAMVSRYRRAMESSGSIIKDNSDSSKQPKKIQTSRGLRPRHYKKRKPPRAGLPGDRASVCPRPALRSSFRSRVGAAGRQELGKHEFGRGKGGPGRGKKTGSVTTRFPGRGRAYILDRLERDGLALGR